MALVLTGNLAIGASTGVDATDEATDVAVSAEITKFKIIANVDTVEVPATMTTPIHGRGGAADYAVEIGYLSNDIAGAVFTALYNAMIAGTPMHFTGSMRTGSVSASNPEWSGEFIVTEAALGGKAEGLSESSATFPMTGPPVKETT